MKKLILSLPLAAALVLAATSAFAAEEGKEFGNAGVLAIGARTGLDFNYTSTSGGLGSSTSSITFAIQPEAQYFVIDGLSVGGMVAFALTKPKEGDSSTLFGIGPEVGYNIWLSPGVLSLWPQVYGLFTSESVSISSTSGTGTPTSTSATNTKFSLGAFVPLLIHPAKHFHFGVGPYFQTDLSSSLSVSGNSADGSKVTTIGLRGEIGGWL